MNQLSRIAIRSVMTAIAVFMVTALLQLPLKAQNFYGLIVVTDSAGAVVPGASLTVTNILSPSTGVDGKAPTLDKFLRRFHCS